MHTIGVQSRKRALQLMQIIFAKRQLDSMTEEDRHALRRRKLRDRLMFVLTNKISARKTRRVVKRNEGGWKASTINQYIETGDETTYRLNFRVSKETFDMITTKLQNAGYVKTNAARNRAACQTAAFKIGVCMYFLAHGKGDAKVVGDAAGIGASTVRSYVRPAREIKLRDGVPHTRHRNRDFRFGLNECMPSPLRVTPWSEPLSTDAISSELVITGHRLHALGLSMHRV
jgi:hypothetical protein